MIPGPTKPRAKLWPAQESPNSPAQCPAVLRGQSCNLSCGYSMLTFFHYHHLQASRPLASTFKDFILSSVSVRTCSQSFRPPTRPATQRPRILISARAPNPRSLNTKKMPTYLGAIDQGTTSSRFIIFDTDGDPVAQHQIEFKQIHPESG